MVNRILKWWKDVMDWKERFEKLLPSNYINGRAFRKAEMRKLEKIIAYPKAKLNEDERLSQKMLYQQQYRELERSLYPNPLVRLVRNAGKLAFSTLKWSYNSIKGTAPPRLKNKFQSGKTGPMGDVEIRQFLKRSLTDSETMKRRKDNLKVTSPDTNKKVSTDKAKKTALIVPFKPAKTIRKGI